jgi:hypothetical protein
MAAANPRHNRNVQFFHTLPVSVDKSNKQAVWKWAGKLRAGLTGEQWKNRNARAGVSRHEVFELRM